MEKQLTHYRKVFNSPYLSSADIVEPTVLTISKVTQEIDKTQKTKDIFNTAYFQEKFIRDGEALKPMILNATNSRTMKKLTDKDFIEEWSNTVVTIYVDTNVKHMGTIVDGLRISTEPPITRKPDLIPDTDKWDRAIKVYKEDGKFDRVEKHVNISDKNKEMIIELAKEAA